MINKNNVKINYSCINNISKIIDNHKKLINKLDWNNNDNLKHSCNYKIKNECPLGKEYNLNNIIYQANISTKENDTNDKAYIGIISLNWKFRYYNHLESFKNPTWRNQTALSRYSWYLIELGLTPITNSKIIKRSSSTNTLHGKCNLCLEEKICILKYLNGNLQNTRTEMISASRHRNKFLI